MTANGPALTRAASEMFLRVEIVAMLRLERCQRGDGFNAVLGSFRPRGAEFSRGKFSVLDRTLTPHSGSDSRSWILTKISRSRPDFKSDTSMP